MKGLSGKSGQLARTRYRGQDCGPVGVGGLEKTLFWSADTSHADDVVTVFVLAIRGGYPDAHTPDTSAPGAIAIRDCRDRGGALETLT